MKSFFTQGIALLLVAGAMVAHAQTVPPRPIRLPPGTKPKIDPGKVGPPTAKDPIAANTVEPRMLKIQQLRFDRRTSAILKAWSTPAGSDKENKDPKTEDPNAPPKDEFDLALEEFASSVTLGQWSEVKSFLASLPEDEGKTLYEHLIDSFTSNTPSPVPGGSNLSPAQIAQMGSTVNDLVNLAALAAHEAEHG